MTAWFFFPLPRPAVEGAVAAPSGSCWILPDGAAVEVPEGGHASALDALARAGVTTSSMPAGWVIPPYWIRVCSSRLELAVQAGSGATQQGARTLAAFCRRIPIPDRAVLERRSGTRTWAVPGCRNPALALAGAYNSGEI